MSFCRFIFYLFFILSALLFIFSFTFISFLSSRSFIFHSRSFVVVDVQPAKFNLASRVTYPIMSFAFFKDFYLVELSAGSSVILFSPD